MTEHFIESSFCKTDTSYKTPLRPDCFHDFVGQEAVCEQLAVIIEAAKMRKEPLNHVLFSGPPGLGKTTHRQALWGRGFDQR